jgi:hypothetical protein
VADGFGGSLYLSFFFFFFFRYGEKIHRAHCAALKGKRFSVTQKKEEAKK